MCHTFCMIIHSFKYNYNKLMLEGDHDGLHNYPLCAWIWQPMAIRGDINRNLCYLNWNADRHMHSSRCSRLTLWITCFILSHSKPEPNMLKILLIVPSSTSQKLYPLFFFDSHIITNCSHFVLFGPYCFKDYLQDLIHNYFVVAIV